MKFGFGLLPKNWAIVAGTPANWRRKSWDDAGHIQFERQVGALTLHHPPPHLGLA